MCMTLYEADCLVRCKETIAAPPLPHLLLQQLKKATLEHCLSHAFHEQVSDSQMNYRPSSQ